MGMVYKAREIELDRIVAVKLLHPTLSDEENRARFVREGKILSSLSHPYILTFYRFGIWQQRFPYIAMEFVSGRTLLSLLQEQPLAPTRAIPIAMKLCEAMAAAHMASIVHRDLKPGNLFLLSDQDDDFVKILDFGLSRTVSREGSQTQHLTQTGELVGTVSYMSPEQCKGQRATSRSDIYALGCVFYEMLSGQPPLSAENPIALLQSHINVDPIPLSEKMGADFPAALDLVLAKAMAKNPNDRYQTMNEFRDELELVQGGKGDSISCPRLLTPKKRQRLPLATAAFFLLVAASLLFVAMKPTLTGFIGRQAEKSWTKITTLPGPRATDETSDRIAHYKKSLARYGAPLDVDSARIKVLLAKELLTKGLTYEAFKYSRESLQVWKKIISIPSARLDRQLFNEALHAIADCHLILGEYRQRRTEFGKYLRLVGDQSSQASFWLELADMCRQDGEYIAAVIAYERFFGQLASYRGLQDRRTTLVNMAKCLHQVNKNADAERTLVAACKIKAYSPFTVLETAQVYKELGDFKNADRLAREAESLCSNTQTSPKVKASLFRADILESQGEAQRARESIDKLWNDVPEQRITILNALAPLARRNNLNCTLDAYVNEIVDRPIKLSDSKQEVWELVLLAKNLARLGRSDLATKILDADAQLFIDQSDVLADQNSTAAQIARDYCHLEHCDKAEHFLSALISNLNTELEQCAEAAFGYKLLLGEIKLLDGKPAEALEAYDELLPHALELEGEDPLPLIQLEKSTGIVFRDGRQYEEAEKHLSRALYLSRKHHLLSTALAITTNIEYAELIMLKGDLKRADECVTSSLNEPLTAKLNLAPRLYLIKAQIYASRGELKKATAEYEKFLEETAFSCDIKLLRSTLQKYANLCRQTGARARLAKLHDQEPLL